MYCIVLYGMVWYGMVWYGMVWYGMVGRMSVLQYARLQRDASLIESIIYFLIIDSVVHHRQRDVLFLFYSCS